MMKNRFYKWMAVGLLAIGVCGGGKGQCSEISTTGATKFNLKPMSYATSNGTVLDWGDYIGYPISILPSMWGQQQFRGWVYSFFGYAQSGMHDFHIDNYHGSDTAVIFGLSRVYTDKARVYGNGTFSLADGDVTPSERLYVDGQTRVNQGLRVNQGIALNGAPSANPVIRPYATTSPSTSGAIDGDLAFDTDADPSNGNLSGGSGAWVVYDSTTSAWKVMKQY